MDRSIEPRINIDRKNGSPAQGVKKTNKHYSYVERLSLSYSSHELVNTMKRSSRSRISAHPHNEVYQNIKSKRFSRLPRRRKITPILVLINSKELIFMKTINLRKNLLISLKKLVTIVSQKLHIIFLILYIETRYIIFFKKARMLNFI